MPLREIVKPGASSKVILTFKALREAGIPRKGENYHV